MVMLPLTTARLKASVDIVSNGLSWMSKSPPTRTRWKLEAPNACAPTAPRSITPCTTRSWKQPLGMAVNVEASIAKLPTSAPAKAPSATPLIVQVSNVRAPPTRTESNALASRLVMVTPEMVMVLVTMACANAPDSIVSVSGAGTVGPAAR